MMRRIFDKSPNIIDCLRTLADQSFVDARTLSTKIDPEPYYLHNVVPYKRSDPEADLPLLMEALEAVKDADGLYTLGRTFFDYADTTNARACFEKVTNLRPNFPQQLYDEASTAYTDGRYQEAAETYDYQLLLQPDDADAWNNKGSCLHDMGRDDEALAACRRAMELQPKDPELWRRIARLAESCRDPIMAEKALLRALELEREEK